MAEKFKFVVKQLIIPFALIGMLVQCAKEASDFQVYDLKSNLPFEFTEKHPISFSWKNRSDQNNWAQEAYQIVVSGSRKSLKNTDDVIWDSGKMNSNEQLFIPYRGKLLTGGETYYWKVKVWQKDGNAKWSNPSSFVVPISYPDDWKAKWITSEYKKEAPMPLFRKSFMLKKGAKPVSARLYICGLGYYEAYLNGKKIGDRVLEPAQTNYEDFAYYSAYDIQVSDLKSDNALGIILGNGWYNQYIVWSSAMAYGQPIAIAQLVVHYTDGQFETVGTDESWKWTSGPITSTNIYAGESYDANLEIHNWAEASLDDQSWNKAQLASTYPPKIFEQTINPIRRMAKMPTVQILEPSANTWVFDFGQNFAGWARLKVNGKKGQKITLRFTEEIDKNNNIDPTSTGVRFTKVLQTDEYTCKGGKTEIWEPRFTYHGFRYVEVTGLDSKPENDLLTGVVVYSSMENNGTFSCSEPQINKLHDLALWTLKSNVHSIPTDCPIRERCGWTGDAHTLAPTLIQNFDARLFLNKYLYDMRSSARNTKKELCFGLNFDDRSYVIKPAGIPTMIVPGKRTSGIASPDWGTAATQIPWQLYQKYGDLGVLREFYPDMKTWVDYISDIFPDGIVNHGLGDWCPPGGNDMIDCPVPLSSTAFHFLDLSILAKTAYLLEYNSDETFYSMRIAKVKELFNKQFFDVEKNTYGSQTANVLAIQLGLVPDGKTPEIVKTLVQDIKTKSNGFIQTGIFGLGRIFPSLAENGAEEFAYNLFTKKGVHSFAYMWDNWDATTLWEVLPVNDALSRENTMIGSYSHPISHSHPMNAVYDEWFIRGIAGIHSDEKVPGYKNIVFRPYFTSKLKNAEATYESPYGTIVSSWKWEGSVFIWDIEIPSNSSGVLYVPKKDKIRTLSINGKSIDLNDLSIDPNYPEFWLYDKQVNGKYRIEME